MMLLRDRMLIIATYLLALVVLWDVVGHWKVMHKPVHGLITSMMVRELSPGSIILFKIAISVLIIIHPNSRTRSRVDSTKASLRSRGCRKVTPSPPSLHTMANEGNDVEKPEDELAPAERFGTLGSTDSVASLLDR